jgi:hypothetical protein
MALRAGLAETCKLGYTGRSQSGNAVNRGGAGIPVSCQWDQSEFLVN